MSDKLNEQADKMREMAQATLDKARDAVYTKYIGGSTKNTARRPMRVFGHPIRARKR